MFTICVRSSEIHIAGIPFAILRVLLSLSTYRIFISYNVQCIKSTVKQLTI